MSTMSLDVSMTSQIAISERNWTIESLRVIFNDFTFLWKLKYCIKLNIKYISRYINIDLLEEYTNDNKIRDA